MNKMFWSRVFFAGSFAVALAGAVLPSAFAYTEEDQEAVDRCPGQKEPICRETSVGVGENTVKNYYYFP